MMKKTKLPDNPPGFLHAKSRKPIFFVSKKGEVVPILILAIALLLVIYSYFLPVSEKCKFIPSLPDCSFKEQILYLNVTPGLLEKQDTAARYILPDVQLFRLDTVDVDTVMADKKTSKGWFYSAPATELFQAQQNARAAKLFIFVNKASGSLKVYVNGEYQGNVYGEGLQQITINANNLKEINSLEIVPTIPLIPFFLNTYEIGKIILKEDYIITNNRVSLPFSITEDPKDIRDVTLNFRTRCVTDENLTAYIGPEKVAEDRFCKNFAKDVTDEVIKTNFSGNLTFTSEGNYIVNEISLDVRMNEKTWPTYNFYFEKSDIPVMLNLGFNETGMKKLTAYVNGKAISVETARKEWNTDISRYLKNDDTNSVLLIPEENLVVSGLEVSS